LPSGRPSPVASSDSVREQRLSLEMTISREDFLRLLPEAVGLVPRAGADGVFRHAEGARRWSLALLPLEPLRLGRLSLVRHRVELTFEGHAEAEVAAFMARFHRGFQRGGG